MTQQPRTELPTGLVTFLFTDIEGSTQLLQELAERYRALQDRHGSILRRAISEAGGVEIRTEGDSFFAVFDTPTAAIRATIGAQRALAAEAWPHGRPLRVRMGLHTGEGIAGGDDYLGIDVNRAARIAAAAWGGQVLLSEATRTLIDQALPDGVTLRSQGRHRLKDLREPELLYDLVIDGVLSDFPPPRTLGVPGNLPPQLTTFVGRETEIAGVEAALDAGRLVTLTGPGGTGKTRLALEVALRVSERFRDGTFFVELASVSEAALVIPTIAATLGVREEGWERVVEDSLREHLRDRRMLLVLDNFEQIIDSAAKVPALLADAPSLRIIVTSRAPLRVRGERVIAVNPLSVPSDGALSDRSRSEAATLFVERARAVGADLDEETAAEVGEIVSRLDGLPLAIELAASRAAFLPPRLMLSRLDHRLPLLGRGARDLPERQQTLRTTIAWSYDLLADPERALFRRLSVMSGGATVESARAVCLHDGDANVDILVGLTTLAENSLLQTSPTRGDEPRFAMLQTIREFGSERLELEDDAAGAHRRLSLWVLDLAERAEAGIRGPDLPGWIGALQAEHENLRAVLRWAIEADEGRVALRIVAAVWRFWHLAGYLSEGRSWVNAVLQLPSARERTAARARALAAAGGLAYWQHDVSAMREAYEESLAISRELEDEEGTALGTYNLAFAHGLVAARERARSLFEESASHYERLDDRLGKADVLWALAMMARLSGEFELAQQQADESVRLHRELQDPFGLMDALEVAGRAALETGRLDVARSCYLEIVEALSPIGYRTGVAIALEGLAALESGRGNHERALQLAGAAEALKEAAGGQVPPEFADFPDPREHARGSLDSGAIAEAWEQGRAMTLEEVLSVAQSVPLAHLP